MNPNILDRWNLLALATIRAESKLDSAQYRLEDVATLANLNRPGATESALSVVAEVRQTLSDIAHELARFRQSSATGTEDPIRGILFRD